MDRKFSLETQPKIQMKITTKCERIQPTCAGLNTKGELVWEGREMPRWQMEMFKVFMDWAGSRYARWAELFNYQEQDCEFCESDSLLPDEVKAMPKEQIEQRKRMYPNKNRRRVVTGD